MKRVAFNDGDGWRYWDESMLRPLNGEGAFRLPANAAETYSWQRLRTFGLYVVGRDHTDEQLEVMGKRVVSTAPEPEDRNGKPFEVVTLEDVPAAQPASYRLYISRLIDRMEPDEADILEAVLQSPETPSKLRMLFYSSEYIDSADPLMAIMNWTIWQALLPTMGDEASARADELLSV